MLANIIRNAKKSVGGGGGGIVTGGDPYYSAVSLLLHMDGTNGSTNFVDSGPNALAVTAVGNTQISTTQSKYGGASAYFDGTGDYLSFTGGMPSGSGTAFTIEFWMMLDAFSTYRSITRTAGGLDINVRPNGAIGCDQTSVAVIAASAAGVIIANTWYHVAVTRDTSNNYKLFVNGTQMGSGTNSFSVTAATTIGYSAAGPTVYFKGYIDDFRATNALRYTSSFTPPAQAHPNIYNPYTTLPVSGAALWLDASQQNTIFSDAGTTPVTTSGQSIYQWNDLSGNNRHAVQATSGNRPTWVPPASGQNGLGVVGFNGATTFLSIADTAGLQFGTGDFTLFFAGVNSDVSRGSAYANTFISKGYTNIEFYQYQGLIQGYIGGTSNSPTTGSGTVSNNSSYVAHMIRSSGSTYVAANNVSGTPVTNTANANGSGTNINIGSRSPFNTTLTYLGSMYEILAFNRALSPTEITSVQSYLKTKWGTP
jgi:hypothetical protein